MKIPGEPVAGRIVGLRCDRTFGCRGCLLHIDERSAIITVHFVGRFIEGQRDLLLCGGSVDGTLGVILLLIFFAYGIAACLPGIAVTVRRLRDAGYNWPYIFVAFIPFVGWIILIVLLCKPTKVEYPFNNFNNPQQ